MCLMELLTVGCERPKPCAAATIVWHRMTSQSNAKRVHLELRLGEINREIDRLVDAIAKGHGDPAILGPRSSLLDEERRKSYGD